MHTQADADILYTTLIHHNGSRQNNINKEKQRQTKLN